ncbi:MAG: transposase [Desulfobacterales bacterium]|nr:transposase [Desulfobacterales bacterium]
MRKKGSLINWINIQINSGLEVAFIQVSGVNLDAETLNGLDIRGIAWVGLPSAKTALLNQEMNRWDFDLLKQSVTRTQPDILEIEGWEVYTKPVLFKDYGEMVFCVVKDFQGNELGCFLLKKEAMHTMISILQEFFTRQQPADNNKLNIGLDLFERAKSADVQAETACGDAWFFVAWFIAKVLGIEGIKRFISKMKSNTEVVYNGQIIKVKELWDMVKLKPVSGRSIKAGAVLVTVKGFNNPLKIVFVQELDKYGRAKARYILVCTDIHFSTEKIIEAYKLRWNIECFFRTAKQRFGLDKFHVRKFSEIHSHITFVFISYLFMACLKISNPKLTDPSFGQIIDRYLKSLVTLKRTAKGVLVDLDPRFFKEFGFP